MCKVHRGEIYYADLSGSIGSEQDGIRPVLIVQNDTGNRHSPTTIVVPITSRIDKVNLPVHVMISDKNCGLQKLSLVLTEQIRAIDKSRLRGKIGEISHRKMKLIDKALEISVGVTEAEKWKNHRKY
jgi:mRNA interferase MazF